VLPRLGSTKNVKHFRNLDDYMSVINTRPHTCAVFVLKNEWEMGLIAKYDIIRSLYTPKNDFPSNTSV